MPGWSFSASGSKSTWNSLVNIKDKDALLNMPAFDGSLPAGVVASHGSLVQCVMTKKPV